MGMPLSMICAGTGAWISVSQSSQTHLPRDYRPTAAQVDEHLTMQPLTGRRTKICLVARIDGITVNPDIIIIEFAAFDEQEAMASVKAI